MRPRTYRLGQRQGAVERTRAAILAATRELIAASSHPSISVGAVAEKAGVSRITIYNRFGSKAGLLRAVADETKRRASSPPGPLASDAREELWQRIAGSCERWAADPALFRRLPEVAGVENDLLNVDRALAERLAASDHLRPGCSLKEAEDVIGVLTAFSTFDRLHKDGRRSPSSVAEILLRLSSAILT